MSIQLIEHVNVDTSSDDITTIKIYTNKNLEKIPQIHHIPKQILFDIKVVSLVLPFRVNNYVLSELIDWKKVPNDPMFQLTFPNKDMLTSEHYEEIACAIRQNSSKPALDNIIKRIRTTLNPHPAGQLEKNIPMVDDKYLDGIQHKYDQTVLFFPAAGQTCHSYCTFCFRWAQFIDDYDLKIAAKEVEELMHYLRDKPFITDVLITGGDPMVMKARYIKAYLEPFLSEELDHIKNIRIGTKSLSFWPQRFVSDADADDLLELFKRVKEKGKNIALMAHYNHFKELDTPVAVQAIKRIQSTGVTIRSQGPLLKHINDDVETWAKLWQKQIALGIVPYYMFVERDTGAKKYFEVPLYKAWSIYQQAIQKVGGLSRTVRGPSMSTDPGKVEVLGTNKVNGEKVFILRFIQARDPDWAYRPFFAKYSETATWLNDLKPLEGNTFFFEQVMKVSSMYNRDMNRSK
ncbi:lysine 2,3-aminomutase [Candidatus Endobugula sertula]|uniref:Lysine 2,3-aminomutase n=1 Tax=Candidatus Endobugula sertula TaxID=62101 RepID=A0A1D2QM88_9GAMM|nr:lysine 2,3-aminomutase [Candidatus Endobugula sertula]